MMGNHPEYERKARRAKLAGYSSLGIGFLGVLLPIIPGILFILLGLSILSTHSRYVHQRFAVLRVRHPHLMEPLKRMEVWIADTLNMLTHTHEYVRIPLRGGREVRALVERSSIPGCSVSLVLHGASGTMETPATQALAEVFRRRGHTVVRFDAYDGLGESAGAYASFTPLGYAENLQDVLAWVHTQSWATPTVHLAGHSIGGTVVTKYAQENPEQVAELVLLSPTISGKSLQDALITLAPEEIKAWKEKGLREVRHPLSGEVFGLGYTFLEGALRYNLIPEAHVLTMPVRIVWGTEDALTPRADVDAFVHAVGEHARVIPILGVPHVPDAGRDIQMVVDALV